MKVRYRDKPHITGYSDKFNMHGLGEVIVTYEGGDASSEEIRELEVWLETQQRWASMSDALRANDLITDNRVTRFLEPRTEQERARGYTST